MSEAKYVSESIGAFRDLVDRRVGFQPILEALHTIPTPFQRLPASDLSETEQSIAELCLEFLELQLAAYPGSLPRSVRQVLSQTSQVSDVWSDVLAPLNEGAFRWSLAEAERWRHSTRISRATDLKTLEAPLAEQMDFALNDRKYLRKFQPPIGKFVSSDPSEIFDDTLFYAGLLKDVLAGHAAPDVRSMNKPRTTPAFRASKGRRLSAKVLEKLVGFVNPVSRDSMDEQHADVLVRSLFQ